MCCRYLALPIDEPEDREDFDDIRWYLLHERVGVFVEDGQWYLHVLTDCRHLQPDYRCGIYETRPRICREYTTENCDYHSGEYGWEQHFTCPEHLDEYVREFFAAKKRRKRASPKNAKSKTPAGCSRLKVKLKNRRATGPGRSYTRATTDIRGTPLPVLGGKR
jgi:Fe-S-cluster containining protein